MTDTYRALAQRVVGMESALRDWCAGVLGAADLDVSVGDVNDPPDAGLLLRSRGVTPDKPPDVGLDFGLMGSWGSGDSVAAGPVPPAWATLGGALRLQFEGHARAQASGGDELPPPQPLDLGALPSALQAWFKAQPEPGPERGGWPGQPWLTDDGRARLPFLSWYPGFEIGLDYELALVGSPPVSPAATFAVLSTALRLERTLPTELPAAQVPPAVLDLLEAVRADAGDDFVPVPSDRVQLSLTVESALTGGGDPALHLSLRLPVLRGVSLRPASQLGWRTAPPKRPSAATPSWRSRDE